MTFIHEPFIHDLPIPSVPCRFMSPSTIRSSGGPQTKWAAGSTA